MKSPLYKRVWPGSVFAIVATGLFFASSVVSQSQTFAFNTLAGYAGKGSADGNGTNALFRQPAGVALDSAGNIYVSDSGNNTIRKITTGGAVITFAGNAGQAGSSNAIGTNALFFQPAGLAVDGAGTVYVADSGNSTIRKITSAGVVSTLAGSAGVTGSNNATGTSALFSHPQSVALDNLTNVYVADYGNNLIRKITPAGLVTTFAGSATNFGNVDGLGTNALFYQPEGITIDSSNNVYVADTANNTIRKITSAGLVSTIAGNAGVFGSSNAVGTNALFYQPSAITVDSAFNLYVTDYLNNTIRKITSAGTVTTLAGSPGLIGSTDGSTTNARFWGPSGIVVDGSGNLYVADYFNNDVRKVTSAGVVTTFVGTSSIGTFDGQGASARFDLPVGGAVDSSGNLYVADSVNHTIRKINRFGQVTTFAGSPGKAGSLDGTGTNALFNGPQAVALDSANNVYVADTLNSTIRKITTSGVVSTLAGSVGTNNSFDGAGTAAAFNHPQGIAVDQAGVIYVADTWNNTIRRISPGGVVTTLAGLAGYSGTFDGTNNFARFNWPKGLAVDTSFNLFVADFLNHTIREITPVGTNWVTVTIAGMANVFGTADGTNNGAQFFEPAGIQVDLADKLYVSDSANHSIREIAPTGTNWVVTTTAGLPGVSGSTDGAGTNVEFFFPVGLALDNTGYLYVMDSENNTIRSDSTIILPLVIEDVSIAARPTSATITWVTSTASTSQIQYGLTTNYGINDAVNSTLQTTQGVLLTGLLTNSLYYYQITSSNSNGVATAEGTFSTSINIILQSSQAQYTGVWVNDASGPDRYSPIYKFATTTNADTADAVFRPTIINPGQYDVAIWYSEGSNRSILAPVIVSFQGGSLNTFVNETLPGGSWLTLTTNQMFVVGTNAFVRLGNFTSESNRIVIADAIQWSYTPSQDLPGNGTLPSWWTSFYFGTTNVNSATLGANGLSLLNDFIIGLSPLDPNAKLTLQLGPLSTNGFQAAFYPWQGGRNYQLYSATNLSHPIWTPVNGITITETNDLGTLVNTNAVTSTTFYRLGVQLSQ